jgi:CheY-like chemotaxis protein
MELRALLMCRRQQSLRLLANTLDELEMTQDCCASAQEAIELLARGSYSALVLDFDLPGAVHVAKLARLAPVRRRPVTFAMIGSATDIADAFKAGANFVLYKPLVVDQVVRCLRAARGFMRRDRRRSVRQTVDTVAYLLFGKKLAIPALMLDLNEEGFCVQSVEPLPTLPEIPVHFLLPGTTYPIEGTAETIWADDAGRAGLFFTRLSAAHQRHLVAWCTRRNSKKATSRALRPAKSKATVAAINSSTPRH